MGEYTIRKFAGQRRTPSYFAQNFASVNIVVQLSHETQLEKARFPVQYLVDDR